jgi:hypothetical protein
VIESTHDVIDKSRQNRGEGKKEDNTHCDLDKAADDGPAVGRLEVIPVITIGDLRDRYRKRRSCRKRPGAACGCGFTINSTCRNGCLHNQSFCLPSH